MLNTYIKNKGNTQTITSINNIDNIEELGWNSNYDGNIATIDIDSNINGEKNKINLKLDNDDLANLLNIDSINTPIDKRIQFDFNDTNSYDSLPYLIELPVTTIEPRKPIYKQETISFDDFINNTKMPTIKKANSSLKPYSHKITKSTYKKTKKHRKYKRHNKYNKHNKRKSIKNTLNSLLEFIE